MERFVEAYNVASSDGLSEAEMRAASLAVVDLVCRAIRTGDHRVGAARLVGSSVSGSWSVAATSPTKTVASATTRTLRRCRLRPRRERVHGSAHPPG